MASETADKVGLVYAELATQTWRIRGPPVSFYFAQSELQGREAARAPGRKPRWMGSKRNPHKLPQQRRRTGWR